MTEWFLVERMMELEVGDQLQSTFIKYAEIDYVDPDEDRFRIRFYTPGWRTLSKEVDRSEARELVQTFKRVRPVVFS